jgi:tRNA dimethylallyltransferase
MEIHRRKHVPIVVGGTHYYIQELLFGSCAFGARDEIEVISVEGEELGKERRRDGRPLVEDLDPTKDGEGMYAKLLDVDPIMARKLHPKDMRRIRRALEV